MANKKDKSLGKVLGQVQGATLRQVKKSITVVIGKDRHGKEIKRSRNVPTDKFAVCHGKKVQGEYSYPEMNDVKDLLNGN
jgi:hypothetical protein